MSYHRKCKKCGRTINMRQMPGGHWVAFEGYDQIHDCSSPGKKRKKYSKRSYESSSIPQEDIVQVLQTAINNNIVVELSYTDKDGNDTHRFVEPRNIDTKFLESFCRLRNERRVFVLDRITSVRLTQNHFGSFHSSEIKTSSYDYEYNSNKLQYKGLRYSDNKGFLIWAIIMAVIIILSYLKQ